MSASAIADRIARQLSWKDLDPESIRNLVKLARDEDLDGVGLAVSPMVKGDVSSRILETGDNTGSARLMAREDLVICGLPLVQLVLDNYGSEARFQPACPDGTHCLKGVKLGELKGPVRQLLEAERVLLNFLQKLSGTASLTRTYVEALGDSRTRLLDTRKTTPGFRVLEKYAVACGGGYNHRIGLFDRVMLKDNHLAAGQAGSGEALTRLVRRARELSSGLVIELEVDHLDQIPPALEAGVDVLLLDNFSRHDLVAAVGLVGEQAATEASGGITLEALPGLASIGLDFISTGATIHQSTWKDIGLDWN